MNIINMTAILERIEEQQMINTQDIVNFVIARLRLFADIFYHPSHGDVRAICNIICYLGKDPSMKATSRIPN